MALLKTLFAGVVAVSVCTAQTNVAIGGKVTDSTGVTSISGATVRLENCGLTTTSGVDGSFLLLGVTGNINSQSNKRLSGKITASLHNGYMSLSLQEQTSADIALHTVQGKELSSIHKTLAKGRHLVALPTTTAGVCFYRIKAGNEEFVLRSIFSTGVSRVAVLSNQGASATALTRQVESYVPINDVIKVEKDGYLNQRVTVTNPDTSGMVIQMILQDAGTVTDIDGNVYHAIRIGNQVWTVQNLRATKYNDGTPVTLDTSNLTWANALTEKYCFYNNTTNADTIKKWGALYNWYVVDPANPKKIAPSGWHVSTDAEWDILQNYLIANGYNWDGTTTDDKIAKSMAAKTDWTPNSVEGEIGCDLTKNNRSGFSALPGGCRFPNGSFGNQSNNCYWWSASESYGLGAWSSSLSYSSHSLYRIYNGRSWGFAVRLLRN